MAKIPTCSIPGCASPAADGMSLDDGGVACLDCETGRTFSEGYNTGLKAGLEVRQRLEAEIERLRQAAQDAAEDAEIKIDRARRAGFEDGKIEGARALSDTERLSHERLDAITRLQGSLVEAQQQATALSIDLEGTRERSRDYQHRAEQAEQVAATATATIAELRDVVTDLGSEIEHHSAEIEQYRRSSTTQSETIERLRAELQQAITDRDVARATERAEVVRSGPPPPRLVQPDVVRVVRRWARGLGAPLSEYDLDALDRALGGE